MQTTTLPQTAPVPGTKLADFHLKLATKDAVTDFKLSEHLGKGPLVFVFYPLAFTGVCTTEVCDMRDTLAQFSGLNAQVYGFSTDTAPSNKAFAIAQGLNFGLLSDPNGDVIGKLWPLNGHPVAGVNRTAKRGAMVVNADGTVKWAAASDDVKVWVGSSEIRKHLG